jgi:hypothetical protein
MDQFGGKPTMVQVNVLIPSGAPGYAGPDKDVGYGCKPKDDAKKCAPKMGDKSEPAGHHHHGEGEPAKINS